MKETDMVNHPSHYKGKTLEVIDVISDFELNFCLGNALKYMLRAGKKHDKQEDLKKALWYIQRELEQKKESSWKTQHKET